MGESNRESRRERGIERKAEWKRAIEKLGERGG